MLTQNELEPLFIYSKTIEKYQDINKYAITLYEMANNTSRMYFK